MDLGELQDFTGFLLSRVRSRIQIQLAQAMADIPLTIVGYVMLTVIEKNPGVMQNDVCAALRLQKSTIANSLKDLERRGLLVRNESSVDRRRREMRLTDDGKKLLLLAHDRVSRVERQVSEICSKAGLDHLKADLLKMVEALDAEWTGDHTDVSATSS